MPTLRQAQRFRQLHGSQRPFDHRRVDHLAAQRDHAETLRFRLLERGDDLLGLFQLRRRRRERLVDDANLARVDAALAVEAERFGFQHAGPQALHVAHVGEHRVDRLDAGGAGRVDHLAAGPEALAAFVGSLRAEVGGVVLQADGQGADVLARRWRSRRP